MKKINIITDELKKKMLDLLYCDEVYNAILIDLLQNNTENLGDLIINDSEGVITDILHIKNDGNSNFTNFYYTSPNGFKKIIGEIKRLNYNKTLIAGKLEDVNLLFKLLGYHKTITPNTFYKLDMDKYRSIHMKFQTQIRLAKIEGEDLNKVKQFTASFLEAKTDEEIKSVTNTEKISEKIKNGVYLLEHNNTAIGMARFIGKTNNNAEITSVYIDMPYRNKGFGKELIGHMIEAAIKEKKIPVLAASSLNRFAVKTYEAMGFVPHGKYAYEFLD